MTLRTLTTLVRLRLLPFVCITAVLAACGGGGGGVTNPPPVTQKLGSITAGPNPMTLSAGSASVIAVTAIDETGVAILGANGFSFTSSAPAIAEVSATGSVIGISSGTATITVSLTLGGVTKTATVGVTVNGTLPASANVSAGTASNTFQPALAVILRTGKVSFSFGNVEHNVTFDGGNGAPASIANSTSTSVERTFNTAGDFAYQCTIHSGMNGLVIVR